MEYDNLTAYLVALMLARSGPDFDAVSVFLTAENFLPAEQLSQFKPQDGKYRPAALKLLNSVADRLKALTSQEPRLGSLTKVSLENIKTIKDGLLS